MIKSICALILILGSIISAGQAPFKIVNYSSQTGNLRIGIKLDAEDRLFLYKLDEKRTDTILDTAYVVDIENYLELKNSTKRLLGLGDPDADNAAQAFFQQAKMLRAATRAEAIDKDLEGEETEPIMKFYLASQQVTATKSNKRPGALRRIKRFAHSIFSGNGEATPADKEILVDTVSMEVSDGTIKDVMVKGKYADTKARASFGMERRIAIHTRWAVSQMNVKGLNYLSENLDQDSYQIDLADLVRIDRVPTKGLGNYSPENTTFYLSAGSQEKTLNRKSVLDNLDLRLYSDLLGFRSDSPNGMAQLEGAYRFDLNSVAALDIFAFSTTLLDKGKAMFKMTKIDLNLTNSNSKPRNLNLNNKDTTSVIRLLEYSNFDFGVSVDMIKLESPIFTLGYVLVPQFQSTLLDSLGRNGGTRNQYNYIGFRLDHELRATLFDGSKVEFGASFTPIQFWPLDDNVYVNDQFLARTQLEFDYHPGKKNEYRSLFFRFGYYYQNPSLNFSALQLGYSTPISKLFK
jgi:hypothetical protein